MNNPITFESLGFTPERTTEIRSSITRIAPTKNKEQLHGWFPTASEKREGHEVVLAAAHGLLTPEEQQKVKDEVEDPPTPPEQPEQPEQPEDEGEQPDPPKGEDGEGGQDEGEGEGEGETEEGEGEGEGGQGEGQGDEEGGEAGEGEGQGQGEGEGEGEEAGKAKIGDTQGDSTGDLTAGTDDSDHTAHADDATIRKALERIFGDDGKLPPRCPLKQQDSKRSKEALAYWLPSLSSLVNEIRKRFVAAARTKRTRNCKTGKLSLRNPVKIAADSSFVFNKKTKGTNRRVAVAGALDWSGSMAAWSRCIGKKSCLSKLKKLAKLDPWFAPYLQAVAALQNGSYHAAQVRITIVDHNRGHIKGINSEMISAGKAAYGAVQISIPDQDRVRSKVYSAGDDLGAKILMSFTCAYGQWVGANLIRRALGKLGIANFWAGFTGDPYTIRDWGERGDVILPSSSFGGTNSAVGFATLIDQLRTRREERRIAILFTDGDVGAHEEAPIDRSNAINTNHTTQGKAGDLAWNAAEERGGSGADQSAYTRIRDNHQKAQAAQRKSGYESTAQLLEQAWKEGIEVYVIGLSLSENDISNISDVVGKGHAVSVSDIATELPAVIAEIIGNDVHDLKATAKGRGYGLAAH